MSENRSERAQAELREQLLTEVGLSLATVDRLFAYIDRANAAAGSDGSAVAFENTTPVAPGAALTKGQHLIIMVAFRALIGEGMDSLDRARTLARSLGIPMRAVLDTEAFEAQLNRTLDALDAVDALVAGATAPLVPDGVPAVWLD